MNTVVNISIIVPIFNTATYLPRCIDSILCSRFKEFELILVNDGSTDRSCSICKWYEKKDKRVKVINQKHQGVSVARNRGICESQGKWVVFVDSDDFISDDFLSLIMRKECQTQDLLIFDFAGSDKWECCWEKKENFQKKVFGKQYIRRDNPLMVERMLHCHQLMKGGHTDMRSVGAKAYKRKIIQQYLLEFPVGIVIGEDQIFHIHYQMKVNHCMYLQKTVYYIETRPDSATQRYHTDTWKQYLHFIRHLEHVLKSYPYFSIWEEAYYDAVLANLKGMLLMGVFHPLNPDSVSKKYKLCHRIRKLQTIKHAVKYSNKKTGDWTRKVLLLFFWLKCYPAVSIICRIGHIRMRWKKR